jgi:peptidyl-prolyl cis-trans isomerase C
MKQTLLISALCAAFATHALAAEPAAAPPAAAEAKKPLAVVNGVAVPALFANFVRQGRIARNANPEALTDESIRDALITVELLAQEAAQKGLDKNASVQAAIEYQKKDILAQAAMEDFARRHPIGEDVLKAEYDKAKAKAGTSEYRPRHILVPTEKEARALIAKLTTGKKAKFEDLAKSSSKDASAGNGGDLGWILPANLVPEFANAMVKLKKGEITKDPVQTQFGWHVIKLDDSRTLDFPAYDKLKGRIASQMQQMQMRKFVQELRATSKVE